ncbi:alpha/beta hydrolase [Mycobacterium sp.]|uniref:alpha/beta fold hydrolase n=1 Tax=Mycobacterium sp. TaxID=1785 RepID=UPI0025CCD513|nr:alpha/beta hydrolase [Mycobacterium sp.]
MTPLACIHGFSGSSRHWQPILPMLAEHHDVHVVSLAGHAGGAPLADGERATVATLADHLERDLDARGIEQAHLVGNSLGGWLALEMATRGRALSVVALSPALGWYAGRHVRMVKWKLAMARRLFTVLDPIAPQALRVPSLRRLALGAAVAHTDAMSPTDAAAFVNDNLRCEVYFELIDDVVGTQHQLGAIECPVRIAWSERDALIPYEPYGLRFPALVPNAEFTTLPGVGHVPMYDDPHLVAQTVLEVTNALAAGSPRQRREEG